MSEVQGLINHRLWRTNIFKSSSLVFIFFLQITYMSSFFPKNLTAWI